MQKIMKKKKKKKCHREKLTLAPIPAIEPHDWNDGTNCITLTVNITIENDCLLTE